MVVSSIRDKVSSAASSAKDAVKDVASASKGAVKGLGDGISKVFDHDIFEDLGLSKLVEVGVDLATGQRSLGSLASSALDSLGLPDWAADIAGVAVDVMTGNKKGAIKQGISAAQNVAESAGIDRAAEFLDTAGDVVGMASGSVGSPGDFKAVAKESISSAASGSVPDGLVSGLASEAGLGVFSDTASIAGDLAENLESVSEAVSAFRDGDVGALGSQFVDTFGGSSETLSKVAGEVLDPDIADILRDAVGDGGRIVDTAIEQFGDSATLSEMASSAVLDRLGFSPEDAGGAASSFVDLARQINSLSPDIQTPGSAIMDSSAGQSLIEGLREIARDQMGGAETGVGADRAVLDMASMARGLMDMAGLNSAVSSDLASTLQQLGAMSSGGRVGDLIGAQVRV